jgi:ATP-binding cassette, subfamily B, vacuolar membrane transporter HMT1/ACLQ
VAALLEQLHGHEASRPTSLLTRFLQIYNVGAFFVYCLFLISLLDSKPSPTAAHLATWSFAAVLETAVVGLSIALYTHIHKQPALHSSKESMSFGMTSWEAGEIAIGILRIILLLALTVFYIIFVVLPGRARACDSGNVGETTSLLDSADHEIGSANSSYGSTHPVSGEHSGSGGALPAWSRPTGAPSRSWWEYLCGYRVFFPYLWPSKDRRLQVLVVVCFLIVLAQRVVNLMVPNQVGKIVNELADEKGGNPWKAIIIFISYRLVQGNNGLLGAIQSTLWIPVGQYSYRELSVAAFEHVHSLSLDFHLGKKTGEVLSALGKGNSINIFLEQVTFQVVPMLVDLAVAIGYFLIEFNAYYALAISIITFWYIYLTIRMAQRHAEKRREVTNANREEDAVKYVAPCPSPIQMLTATGTTPWSHMKRSSISMPRRTNSTGIAMLSTNTRRQSISYSFR